MLSELKVRSRLKTDTRSDSADGRFLIRRKFGINSELHLTPGSHFRQSVKEMYRLLKYQGADSIDNLSVGAGDLYVTVYGGRTRLIGILLGRGLNIDEAKAELKGVTLESLVVAERVARAVRNRIAAGELKSRDFPLLLFIDGIITNKMPVDIPWEAFTI